MNLLVRNARIWTGDVEHPEATDVLIEDGRITAIGGSEVAATAPAGTPELDAAGRRVTPGFIDSHNHLRLGSGEGAVQLAGAKSIDEIRARIAAWLDENHDATWVHGEGFDYAAIPEGRHPRADDLDGATRGLPTMLLDYSVHAAWFNREALAALGADAQSPTAPFGTYEVDDATGELTGYLANFATAGISRAGQAALERVVPAYSRDAQYARVRSALAMAARYGLTTVVEPQNSVDDIELFERARAEGVLHSRVVAALFHPSGTSESEIDELEHVIASRSSDRITLGPIKLYIDDIVEGVVRVTQNIPKPNPAWDPALPDPSSSMCPYKLYNIGNNSSVTLLEFIEAIETALGKKAIKEFLPLQPGDVPATCADIDDLIRDVGFKPSTTIQTGIANFIDWYREYYLH